jgi:hypothetical protein
MEHVAIDIGGKESQICVRASDGEIVHERRHRTDELEDFFKKRSPSVVVFETCSEAFALADLAKAARIENDEASESRSLRSRESSPAFSMRCGVTAPSTTPGRRRLCTSPPSTRC